MPYSHVLHNFQSNLAGYGEINNFSPLNVLEALNQIAGLLTRVDYKSHTTKVVLHVDHPKLVVLQLVTHTHRRQLLNADAFLAYDENGDLSLCECPKLPTGCRTPNLPETSTPNTVTILWT
jgi:hypothetical protein